MWVASRGFLGARFSHSAMGALGASESEDMRLALFELVPVKGKPKGEPPLLGSPKNRHHIYEDDTRQAIQMYLWGDHPAPDRGFELNLVGFTLRMPSTVYTEEKSFVHCMTQTTC